MKTKDKAFTTAKQQASPNLQLNLGACRDCRSTDMNVLDSLPDQHYSGTHCGRDYSRIERKRVLCNACGTIQVHSAYHQN